MRVRIEKIGKDRNVGIYFRSSSLHRAIREIGYTIHKFLTKVSKKTEEEEKMAFIRFWEIVQRETKGGVVLAKTFDDFDNCLDTAEGFCEDEVEGGSPVSKEWLKFRPCSWSIHSGGYAPGNGMMVTRYGNNFKVTVRRALFLLVWERLEKKHQEALYKKWHREN